MTLIDGDRIITAQLYDDEHEEFTEKKMSIIDYINAYTDEGVTAADVVEQPKTGHWIELGYLENDNYDFECSVCHHTDTHSKTVKVNYCWNCGAKMEEVEE